MPRGFGLAYTIARELGLREPRGWATSEGVTMGRGNDSLAALTGRALVSRLGRALDGYRVEIVHADDAAACGSIVVVDCSQDYWPDADDVELL